MKYLFFIISLFIKDILYAQKVPKYIRTAFTNCYADSMTGIEHKLELNGYYELVELGHWVYGYGKKTETVDSHKLNMIFYKDGSFKYNFFSENDEPMSVYFKRVSVERNEKYFYNSGYWGIYKIVGDTIICHYLNKGKYREDWFACEVKFKIRDRHTLEMCYDKPKPLDGRATKDYRPQQKTDKYLPAKFIPCEVIPPPNSWLKKQDWVWCQ